MTEPMRAYVAVTDTDWFDFLVSQAPPADEVNFWQPRPWGGEFRVLTRGEPLLFKLKSPLNAIAGGGYFERYAELPLSLAWDAFGTKNGAPTRQAAWDRIARLRRTRAPWWEDFTIACLLLAEPFFFSPDRWIPQPPDFGKTTIRGKHYDLSAGIGAALWKEVVTRLDEMPVPVPMSAPAVVPGGYSLLWLDGGSGKASSGSSSQRRTSVSAPSPARRLFLSLKRLTFGRSRTCRCMRFEMAFSSGRTSIASSTMGT